ncbi:MAG: peptidoglycan-associated lipoprotein Pal [Desulfobacteraceae bacterium]|nr:peptidoglycan-associated lipoprotein Pal [Desulfobacteraceae bacterium]
MNACKRVVVAVGCLSLVIAAAGCANKEVVKKDETISREATVAPATVKPAPAEKGKSEVIPAAGSTARQATQANQQAAKAGASQAEFEKIYFDFDSADLNQAAKDTLARSAELLMKKHKDIKLRVEGNCDERGSAEYNIALGERRAQAAVKYLETMGVRQDRISAISYGKERPAVQGNDEAAWQKNRRDEFVIMK